VTQRSSGSSAGAVLWDTTSGRTTLLRPLPNDSFSQAFAINNLGQVVGLSSGSSKWRAVLAGHLGGCAPEYGWE